MYAIHNCKATLDAALALCRGNYQRAIIMGHEALSGATLRGKAKQYSGNYRISAERILQRCQQAEIAVREVTGGHNKRMVQVG